MKILVIRPDENPKVEEIDGTLESMQAIVGGYIQSFYPWRDDIAVICNEEGKLLNMPLNRFIIDEDGQIVDFVAGNFFLCYAPPEAENFQSLPENLIQKYTYLFSKKEI